MGVLIINFKNYEEVLGESSIRLAETAQRASKMTGQDIIVAPPTPMIALVASKVDMPVFAQGVSPTMDEKSTGSVSAEAIRAAGAIGSLLNHSESRLPPSMVKKLVPHLARRSLEVCLCVKNVAEVKRFAPLKPDFLAVEPPELIGSGVAVSKARPSLVRDSVDGARVSGYGGKVLCGAGIVTGEDVATASRLGAEGVLVSSSIVKAKDWDSKILELARSLK